MIYIHNSIKRGKTKLDWLESYHSFSFGQYYNPQRKGFGKLLVLNDDRVAPSKGFGMHQHKNMEIISLVLEGTLEHTDNMGNKGTIKKGEIQVMSAGSGVMHSEYNPSKDAEVHFLQIWIEPKLQNIKPRYYQKNYNLDDSKTQLITLISNKENSINQDTSLFLATGKKNTEIKYTLKNKVHGIFIFVIEGKLHFQNNLIQEGDSVEVKNEGNVVMQALENSKILIIEFPLD